MLQNSATLVAYRTFSDLFGKAAFFFITVVAARHLSAEAFGLFAIGSTMGWLAAVAADCGMQMHLARSVARAPDQARRLLREWLRLRLRTSGVLLAALTLFLVWSRGAGGDAAALVLFLAAYLTSGIVEFVNYFYRGLSRSDIESTLTLVQRGTLLVAATLVLRWTPDVTALAATLFVSGLATLAVSLRTVMRVPGRRGRSRRTKSRAAGGSSGPRWRRSGWVFSSRPCTFASTCFWSSAGRAPTPPVSTTRSSASSTRSAWFRQPRSR
jgi:O-antigen/teichoic acid export membrane protein